MPRRHHRCLRAICRDSGNTRQRLIFWKCLKSARGVSMQTADAASRQVDGRCLVSILVSAVPSALTSSLSLAVRVTGCPQNHFTEPFSRLPHRESFLPLISLFTPLGFILAVTTPFSTLTSLTYLPLISEADATPAAPLFAGHSPLFG